MIADIARALRRESSDESGLAEVLEDEKFLNARTKGDHVVVLQRPSWFTLVRRRQSTLGCLSRRSPVRGPEAAAASALCHVKGTMGQRVLRQLRRIAQFAV